MAWALSRITGIPCCVSLHADYEKRESLQGGVIPSILGSKAFAARVEQFVYHHVDLILPIRESLAEKVKTKGGTTSKIRIFPHGVDLSAFSFVNSLEWLSGKERLSDRKIISIVCRLEKENYTTDVLSVAEILSKRREDNIFLIAGDGSQMESMKAQIILRGLAERVLLLGFIPMEQVVSLRQNSFLSLCLMGGFSLIEACAAGRPVISYDVEWHSELVHNNETGFLIPEGDVAEVVGRIEYLLDHPCSITSVEAPFSEGDDAC
jgi:glycosyltransferase involved in cell wall biosynthesis